MSEKRNRVFIIHEDSIDHDSLISALCSLDARELVRCKDCKFGVRSSDDYYLCAKAVKFDQYRKANWYCADGEMK